ncbi:MAG: ECF transporter S component [Clostridia bacterium]|nr:ECF transporter S component [Clostridia bacterium]
MNNVSKRTKDLTKMAILTAISLVLVTICHFPILPALSFLEYDPADVPILLGTFAMGPAAGLLMTLAVCLIQAFLLGGNGLYGALMHFIATGTFVFVAGSYYKSHKTKKGAVIAIVLGIICWIIVMVIANIFITPAFMGAPREAVISMLPGIALFNVIISAVNSAITFLLYKRVSGVLHR